MPLPTWVEKYKEPKTEIRQIKGHFYKYQVAYRYNKDKKRSDKVTVALLGKITEGEGLIPSPKRQLKERAERATAPDGVDIKTFGVFGLYRLLLGEDIGSLGGIIGERDLEVLLAFSLLRFAHQAPIKRAQQLHRHDYSSLSWHKAALTDKVVTQTLRAVGERRQAIVEWMRGRVAGKGKEGDYILMDSTQVASASRQLGVCAPGYNRAQDYGAQVRLMYLFSVGKRQPVYYRLINGDINDLASMRACIEEIGLEDVVFIADKGFYSKTNIAMLVENGVKYIIPVHRNNYLIDFSPIKSPDFKRGGDCFLYQNRVVWHYSYDCGGSKATTFLDEALRVEEEADYIRRMATHPEKYDREGFNKKQHAFGTLTLLTNVDGTSAFELYTRYKERNEVELMLDAYKNFMDADTMYMQNRIVLEGWLMANFLAMVAFYRLLRKIEEAELTSKYSPKDIIEISKTIFKLRMNGEWVTSEVTKKNRDLLKKLNIDYLN